MELSPNQLKVKSVLESWRETARRQEVFINTDKAIEEAESTASWLMETEGWTREQKLGRLSVGIPDWWEGVMARSKAVFRSEFTVTADEAAAARDRIRSIRGLIVENRLRPGRMINIGGDQDEWGVLDNLGEFVISASKDFRNRRLPLPHYLNFAINTHHLLRIDAMLSLDTRTVQDSAELTFVLTVVFPLEKTVNNDSENMPDANNPHLVDKHPGFYMYRSGESRLFEAMTTDEFTVVNYYLGRTIRRLPTV